LVHWPTFVQDFEEAISEEKDIFSGDSEDPRFKDLKYGHPSAAEYGDVMP